MSQLGGGLVVIAGPRFGPRELYQTPLADMLPVIVDPNAELRAYDISDPPIVTTVSACVPMIQLCPDGLRSLST